MADNININKSNIDTIRREATLDLAQRCKDIGTKANDSIRRESVLGWLSSFGLNFSQSGNTMLKAIKSRSYGRWQGKNVYQLTFVSYIDSNMYDIEHTRLYQYNTTHQGKWSGYSANDMTRYIVGNLQWEHGILGLPERSSDGSWKNSHFHQAPVSLMAYTINRYKWGWKKRLHSYGL